MAPLKLNGRPEVNFGKLEEMLQDLLMNSKSVVFQKSLSGGKSRRVVTKFYLSLSICGENFIVPY